MTSGFSCASYRLNSLMIFFFLNINYSRSGRYTCAKLPCRHLLPVTHTHSAHVSHHFVIAQQTHTLFCGDQTAHKNASCIKPSDLQKIPLRPKKHSFSDDFPTYKCFSCNWLFWHLQRNEWWLVWPSGSSAFMTLTLKAHECLWKVSMKVRGDWIYINFQAQQNFRRCSFPSCGLVMPTEQEPVNVLTSENSLTESDGNSAIFS